MLDEYDDEKLQPTEDELDNVGAALTATPQPPEQLDALKSIASQPVDVAMASATPAVGGEAPSPAHAPKPSADYASLLAGKPLPDDIGDDALKDAQKRDRDNAAFAQILSAGRRAWSASHNEPDIAPMPSEASSLLQRRGLFENGTNGDIANKLKLAQLAGKGSGKTLTQEQIDEIKSRTNANNARGDYWRWKIDHTPESDSDLRWAELERRIRADADKRDWHNKYLDARAKAAAAKAAKANAAPNVENNNIPFDAGYLSPRAGTQPTKDDRKKAQEIASLFGGTLEGMNSLEGALKEYATHPSIENKRKVESQVQGVATALNVAYGQGAMSEAEGKQIKAALGADLLSPSGLQAFWESMTGQDSEAAKTLLTRLESARDVTKKTAYGKIAPYNFQRQGDKPKAPGGTVKMRFPDGSVHDVPAEKLEKAKLKGGVEVPHG